jgi:hypothetical protein
MHPLYDGEILGCFFGLVSIDMAGSCETAIVLRTANRLPVSVAHQRTLRKVRSIQC